MDIECSRCQHKNPGQSRFCGNCGAPLTDACGACGAELVPGAAFCGHCGTKVESEDAGERRQLTVMFCDLAGFTELSQRVDPEDLADVLAVYQQVCVNAVRRFGGHVAQYLGDGVLVYFGYPTALEDAGESALRAALLIRGELVDLNRSQAEGSAEIHARIGIHTGQVVVAEVGGAQRRETLALGDTTNIAARLQGVAGSDEICVSADTLQLVPGLFQTRTLGTPNLKGVSKPLEVFVLEGLTAGSHRFHARGGSTPLLGRDAELSQLLAFWQSSEAGRGQAVLISGEPGIGKSRLIRELRRSVSQPDNLVLELGCSPYKISTAFQPLLEYFSDTFRDSLGSTASDPADVRWQALGDYLAGLDGVVPEEVAPFLGLLLGLSPSEAFPMEAQGPELLRENTLAALVRVFVALSQGQALLVVIEDLHWCDPSTLDVLAVLFEAVPRNRLMLAMTSRPDFAPTFTSRWADAPFATMLLERLDRASVLALVTDIEAQHGALPERVREQVAERADGIPLFAEELARTVAQSAVDAPAATSESTVIPSTLQDSLIARLDRLGASRQTARVAAALGRSFSYELIEHVVEVDTETLRGDLSALVEADLIVESGSAVGAEYTFRHALFQDAAYQSQLRSARRELHARIAGTLKSHFPKRIASEPEVMGHHCAAAGLSMDAVGYFQQAGEQATAQVAYQEAYAYNARALELLTEVDDTQERQLKEIDLCAAQAPTIIALRGYDDDELTALSARADVLLAEVGEGAQQIPGLIKLMTVHTNNLPRARGYASALIDVSEPLQIVPLLMAGYIMRGAADLTTGAVAAACADMEKGLELGEQFEMPPPGAAFSIDPLCMGYPSLANGLVELGRLAQAHECVQRAVKRARELNHVRSLASALQIGAVASYSAADVETTLALSGECLQLIDGRGFHVLEVSARVVHGWALASQGEFAELRAMREALEVGDRYGVVAAVPRLYAACVDAHVMAGELTHARTLLEEAEAMVAASGEAGYLADLAAARGRLLLASGEWSAAQEQLRQGLALAEPEHPWSALLMATLLGRTALQLGAGAAEAQASLSRVCARFDEDINSPRMTEAREMLAQLA